jgi:hypothetical protein
LAVFSLTSRLVSVDGVAKILAIFKENISREISALRVKGAPRYFIRIQNNLDIQWAVGGSVHYLSDQFTHPQLNHKDQVTAL